MKKKSFSIISERSVEAQIEYIKDLWNAVVLKYALALQEELLLPTAICQEVAENAK